jgi:hypothetical protein
MSLFSDARIAAERLKRVKRVIGSAVHTERTAREAREAPDFLSPFFSRARFEKFLRRTFSVLAVERGDSGSRASRAPRAAPMEIRL